MPIPFTCPHCGHQTNVADQYAGQTGPCASCGKTITVPVLGSRPTHLPPGRAGSRWSRIAQMVRMLRTSRTPATSRAPSACG